MGLSRNKVAVSEGAAGSPPFYGEQGDRPRGDVPYGADKTVPVIEVGKKETPSITDGGSTRDCVMDAAKPCPKSEVTKLSWQTLFDFQGSDGTGRQNTARAGNARPVEAGMPRANGPERINPFRTENQLIIFNSS